MTGNGSAPLDLLLAAPRFYPVYAGPSVRFKRYEPGFRARGVSMRVFSAEWAGDVTDPSPTAVGTAGLLDREVIDGIPIDRVHVPARRYSTLRQLHYDRALARYGLSPGNRPDVVQLLSINPMSVGSISKLRRAGVPVVYTHTMARDPAVNRLKNRYWRRPFGHLDCVVVSSGVMRDGLLDLGVTARVEVIPNGLDQDRFRPLDSRDEVRGMRRELGLEVDAELVVFVGGFLSHRKGVDVLLDAWAQVARARPKARLVAVGPHVNKLASSAQQSAFVREVLARLEATGLNDTVTFTGAVENVEQYLQASDLFVFPSRREGMPNVVAEAFGCGVPTILAPFVGLPTEFGRPGSEYDLVDRTPDAFAAAINRMLEQPERRREFGRRARAWGETELALDRSLDLYSALYRELAGSRSRS